MEFAFEDAKELRRRNEILKKIENNRKLHEKKTEINDEEKEKKAKKRKNLQTAAKIQIEQLLENGSISDIGQLREHLKNIISRGLKQRMKKKISAKLGIEMDEVEQDKKPKREKSLSVKPEKPKKKNEEKLNQKQEIRRERSESRRKKFEEEDLEELKVRV